MKRIALVSLLPLTLSACSGFATDTGMTPALPPVAQSPTAKAPVNANPTKPTANENFVNDAVTGIINSSNDGTPVITSVGTNTLTVAYNSSTNSYTLTANGNSVTAGSTNLQPTTSGPYSGSVLFSPASTATTNVYGSATLGNSATVEQVILNTNAVASVPSTGAQLAVAGTGTSPMNNLTLSYVSAGQWIKATVNGPNLLTANVTNFVYGAYTTDAQMPRTGSATYGVTINATVLAGTTGNLFAASLKGYGDLTANFGAGTVNLYSNYMTETIDPSGMTYVVPTVHALTATATMSSSINSFTGTFSYTDQPSNYNSGSPLDLGRTPPTNGGDGTKQTLAPFTGTINGKFYGPAAQEVGATLSGQSPATFLNGVKTPAMLTGTIVGSRGSNPIQ
jgi:hypothetical protein